MKSGLLCIVCSTIVAAFQVSLAASTPVSQDIPVPGGVEGLAHTLSIEPVPDRGRFIAEATRLVYDSEARNPATAAFLQTYRQLPPQGRRMRVDDGVTDLVPVPLSVDLWSNAVFRRKVPADELVMTILADRQASLLCHGLAALDDDTLQFFADHSSLVSRIYERTAPAFGAFASTLRIAGNRVVPAGGAEAVPLWEAAVGEKVTRPERFVLALFESNEGRLAYLYDIAGRVEPSRRAFMLGSWLPNAADRLPRFKSLASVGVTAFHDWHIRATPFTRPPTDLGMVLARVAVDANGMPAPPSSRALWTHILSTDVMPAEGADVRKAAGEDSFDAAWLVEAIGGSDVRQRAERIDQLTFIQRVVGDNASDVSAVIAMARALPHYKTLMLTLESIGITAPSLYAATARQASRLTSLDGRRGFLAEAQFQGALSLVARMALVKTIDASTAAAMIERLVAVPIQEDGRYAGGVARWLQENVVGRLPRAPSVEAAIVAAVSGAPSGEPVPLAPLEWEGQRYTLDLGFAERRRIERVRERQNGAAIDVPLEIAFIARRLGAEGTSTGDAEAVAKQLTDVSRHSRRSAFDGLDGGGESDGESVDVRDALRKPIDELTRAAKNHDAKRLARVAESLVELTDDVLARVLLSFAYALNVGDPDGTVMLAGDVSHRHDFGFALKDNTLRVRATWAVPRQEVAPNVPWHVTGSLLGLDLGLSSLALRRVSLDRAIGAPKLSSTQRETFAASVALMNPYALRNADRDAIVGAIVRGRDRIAALRSSPAGFDAIADEISLDGWRRRGMRWTLAHEPDRLPSMFSMTERIALGGGGSIAALDDWGMSAVQTTGCMCLRVVRPGQEWTVSGRPQLGTVAAAVADLNFHIAMMLQELDVPAALEKTVLSGAMQDFIDEVRPSDDADWLTLARAATTLTREQVEDYLAAATADGPLVPVTQRSNQP